MALSALDDKAREPTDDDVREVLDASGDSWQELREWLRTEVGVERFEWAFSGKKYGWSARAVRGRRRIAYLIPQHGSFLVGLVLGDRAMEAARGSELSPPTREILDAAPRYGEGTGFRLTVAGPADLADVRTLVGIKSRL